MELLSENMADNMRLAWFSILFLCVAKIADAGYYPWGWNGWLTSVPTISDAPTSGVQLGSAVEAQDTLDIYVWDGSAWVIIADGSTGTVTDVSVVDANGFNGTVANATTTPAITIETTVTGVAKGNGTALSSAAASDIVGLFSGCSGTQYLGADGACHSGSSGTVTSVGLTVPSFLSVAGSPITSSGTLAVSYSGTALPIANGGTAVTSVTTAPTATAFAGWDANSNISANSMISGYATTATAAGTTTLTVSSAQQQFFTGTTTQTVKLPVTSTLVDGMSYTIVNDSTGVVTVESSGGNTLQAMAANTMLEATVISTSGTGTASWNWTYVPINSPSNYWSFNSGATTVYQNTYYTGIGTASAQNATLGVGGLGNPALYFTGADSGNKIVFNNPGALMGVRAYKNGSSNTVLGFGYTATTSTNITDVLDVLNTGNVGIGTNSPGSALEVNGDIQDDNLTASRPVISNSSKQLASGTYSGNTTEFATVGASSAAGCAEFDSSGNVTSTGSACASGSVTSISVASSNGFAGSSSGGSTPSLTLSTTVTGPLKGNGTAISAASASDIVGLFTGCSGTQYLGADGACHSASGGSPGGSSSDVQYNSSGSFAGNSSFTTDGSGDATLSGYVSANACVSAYATTVTSSTPITLTVASAPNQYLTGSINQTVVLPVVSTLPQTGFTYSITNLATEVATVESSGGNTISTVSPGQTVFFTAILLTGTSAASWSKTGPNVQSTSSGNVRIESAFFGCNSSGCTCETGAGTGCGWVSFSSRSHAGGYSLTFTSGEWAGSTNGNPTCTFNPGPNTNGNDFIQVEGNSTSAGISIQIESFQSGGTNIDDNFSMICIGTN